MNFQHKLHVFNKWRCQYTEMLFWSARYMYSSLVGDILLRPMSQRNIRGFRGYTYRRQDKEAWWVHKLISKIWTQIGKEACKIVVGKCGKVTGCIQLQYFGTCFTVLNDSLWFIGMYMYMYMCIIHHMHTRSLQCFTTVSLLITTWQLI